MLTKAELLLIETYKAKPYLDINIVLNHGHETLQNLLNILNQTIRVKIITLIASSVPNQIPISNFIQSICCIQKNGGLSMLSKEREDGTIIMYIKKDKITLKDPNMLYNISANCIDNKYKILNYKDLVCINTCIPLKIEDLYTNKYGTYWI